MKVYEKITVGWNEGTEHYDKVICEDSFDYYGTLDLAMPNPTAQMSIMVETIDFEYETELVTTEYAWPTQYLEIPPSGYYPGEQSRLVYAGESSETPVIYWDCDYMRVYNEDGWSDPLSESCNEDMAADFDISQFTGNYGLYAKCDDFLGDEEPIDVRLNINASALEDYVQIGDQCWMAKNLDVTTYNTGEPIPGGLAVSSGGSGFNYYEWVTLDTGAHSVRSSMIHSSGYCGYDLDPVMVPPYPNWEWQNDYGTSNVGNHGNLYNWYAVNDPRGICPEGWHVPSNDDWQTLKGFLGPDDLGSKLAGHGQPLPTEGNPGLWEPGCGRPGASSSNNVQWMEETCSDSGSSPKTECGLCPTYPMCVWAYDMPAGLSNMCCEDRYLQYGVPYPLETALVSSSEFGTSGFNATPGGYRSFFAPSHYTDPGRHSGLDRDAFFWTSTEQNSDAALGWLIDADYTGAYDIQYNKGNGLSVRCISDFPVCPDTGEPSTWQYTTGDEACDSLGTVGPDFLTPEGIYSSNRYCKEHANPLASVDFPLSEAIKYSEGQCVGGGICIEIQMATHGPNEGYEFTGEFYNWSTLEGPFNCDGNLVTGYGDTIPEQLETSLALQLMLMEFVQNTIIGIRALCDSVTEDPTEMMYLTGEGWTYDVGENACVAFADNLGLLTDCGLATIFGPINCGTAGPGCQWEWGDYTIHEDIPDGISFNNWEAAVFTGEAPGQLTQPHDYEEYSVHDEETGHYVTPFGLTVTRDSYLPESIFSPLVADGILQYVSTETAFDGSQAFGPNVPSMEGYECLELVYGGSGFTPGPSSLIHDWLCTQNYAQDWMQNYDFGLDHYARCESSLDGSIHYMQLLDGSIPPNNNWAQTVFYDGVATGTAACEHIPAPSLSEIIPGQGYKIVTTQEILGGLWFSGQFVNDVHDYGIDLLSEAEATTYVYQWCDYEIYGAAAENWAGVTRVEELTSRSIVYDPCIQAGLTYIEDCPEAYTVGTCCDISDFATCDNHQWCTWYENSPGGYVPDQSCAVNNQNPGYDPDGPLNPPIDYECLNLVFVSTGDIPGVDVTTESSTPCSYDWGTSGNQNYGMPGLDAYAKCEFDGEIQYRLLMNSSIEPNNDWAQTVFYDGVATGTAACDSLDAGRPPSDGWCGIPFSYNINQLCCPVEHSSLHEIKYVWPTDIDVEYHYFPMTDDDPPRLLYAGRATEEGDAESWSPEYHSYPVAFNTADRYCKDHHGEDYIALVDHSAALKCDRNQRFSSSSGTWLNWAGSSGECDYDVSGVTGGSSMYRACCNPDCDVWVIIGEDLDGSGSIGPGLYPSGEWYYATGDDACASLIPSVTSERLLFDSAEFYNPMFSNFHAVWCESENSPQCSDNEGDYDFDPYMFYSVLEGDPDLHYTCLDDEGGTNMYWLGLTYDPYDPPGSPGFWPYGPINNAGCSNEWVGQGDYWANYHLYARCVSGGGPLRWMQVYDGSSDTWIQYDGIRGGDAACNSLNTPIGWSTDNITSVGFTADYFFWKTIACAKYRPLELVMKPAHAYAITVDQDVPGFNWPTPSEPGGCTTFNLEESGWDTTYMYDIDIYIWRSLVCAHTVTEEYLEPMVIGLTNTSYSNPAGVGIASSHWDFGDGSTYSCDGVCTPPLMNSEGVYSYEVGVWGNMTVCLTVVDFNNDSDSLCRAIGLDNPFVNDPPTPNIEVTLN